MGQDDASRRGDCLPASTSSKGARTGAVPPMDVAMARARTDLELLPALYRAGATSSHVHEVNCALLGLGRDADGALRKTPEAHARGEEIRRAWRLYGVAALLRKDTNDA